jgi:hypothetical protein
VRRRSRWRARATVTSEEDPREEEDEEEEWESTLLHTPFLSNLPVFVLPQTNNTVIRL